MGLFDWIRGLGHAQEGAAPSAEPVAAEPPAPDEDSEWEELPAYLPVNPHEHMTAVVVASAIAAGDRSASDLTVKNVYIENPEHRRVAVIASALAAGALEKSSFTVRRIYKQRRLEEPHAA